MAKQTLEQWIFEALNDADKDGPCTALALVHRVGVREQEVHTTKIGNKQWNAKDLAKMFYGKAENYAAELPGYQTFNLLAFYNSSVQWEAIKPFGVNGQEELPGLSTEGPTKEGLVQQAMRHTEAMTQMFIRQTQSMTSAMQGMFQQVTHENMALRAENREATIIVRDAVLALQDKKETAIMARLEYQRSTEERAKWLSFGPAFINTLLGREVFPQNVADSSLIDSIADGLTEEDIGKLAATGVFKPEVWGPLAQRMAKNMERKRLAAEQAQKALNGVDPEEDATGGLLSEGQETVQ